MTQLTPLIPQFVAEMRSTAELPLAVTTGRLLSELSDKSYRDAYVAAQLQIGLPFQIKALRSAREWSQGELAHRAGMAQPRISEIEKPGERSLNIETLLRLASAFDCALEVKFVPFSQLVRDSEGYDPANFDIPTFQQDVELGGFSLASVPSMIFYGAATVAQQIVSGPGDTVEYSTYFHFDFAAYSSSAENLILTPMFLKE